jgi:hypothetical protein
MALPFSILRGTLLPRRGEQSRLLLVLSLGYMALAGLAGCQKTVRTEDPQLKPIQAMLEQQLPPRTPEEKVVTFLGNRGYPILPAQKQGTIVANIRRTDRATVQPVVARVTFYFDANRKLNTFELQRPVDEPSRQ